MGSIITELMALDRNDAWFRTSISELVRVQTVTTSGALSKGALNKNPNYGRNIEVDTVLKEGVKEPSIKAPYSQA